MECKSNAEVDDYLYLDAKLLKGGDVAPKNRAPFQDSIVFVIGGGNYIEYQNLVDFIKVSAATEFLCDSEKEADRNVVLAKEHVEHHEADNLWIVNAEQCQAVLEAAFASRTGDQGWQLDCGSSSYFITL
jgi:hypothetical protein